ncbi:MAG: PAS domain S-box protein [Calothrix sp. SM1_7_51]|nr:PAS domain S-box protein [Calothrix sp. SM1_7_51]
MSGYASLIDVEVPVKDNVHVKEVLSQDKAIISDDVYVEPLLRDAREICQHLEIQSMLSVRISYKGEPNGMICLHQCDKKRRWTPEEVELLESIAAQLGVAIAQAQTLEQEKQARLELDRQNILLQQEVSERIAAEVALRQSESQYRDLVETSHDIIWRCDIYGCVTFVNAAIKYHLDYEPEEVIGRNFTDFISLENKHQDIAIFERIISGEPVFENESVYLTKKRYSS